MVAAFLENHMFGWLKRKVKAAAVTVVATAMVAVASVVSVPAMAATTTPIDVTDAVAQIGEINTAVLAVGGALIAAAAIAVGVKWVKATFFG